MNCRLLNDRAGGAHLQYVCSFLSSDMAHTFLIRYILYTRSIINKGHREMTIVVAPFSIPKIP